MKAQLPRTLPGSRRVTSSSVPAPGVVRDATCHMKRSPLPTPAGAKRKSTPDPSLVCLHTPVDRRVRDLAEAAHTHVMRLVTLVRVLLVHPWDQLRTASVAEIPPRNDARTLTMSMDGAAGRSAVTCSHVVNIHAHFRATRACAVPAKSRSRLVVIAAKCRLKCCAAPRKTRWKVRSYTTMDLKRSGRDALPAVISAIAHSTAVCIFVRRAATRRTHILLIALARPMSSFVARAGKHHSPRLPDSPLAPPVKIRFQTAWNHAARCSHVAILVTKSVTLALAGPAYVESQCHVNVAVTAL